MKYFAPADLIGMYQPPLLGPDVDCGSELAVGKVVSQVTPHVFEPGDELYIMRADGTVDRFVFYRKIDKEAQQIEAAKRRARDDAALAKRLLTPIDVDLPRRICNVLRGQYSPSPLPWKIETVTDLSKRTEAELLSIEGFGRSSLRYVKEVLGMYGLYLGMKQL